MPILKKEERFQINNINFLLKKVAKEEQSENKASKRKAVGESVNRV